MLKENKFSLKIKIFWLFVITLTLILVIIGLGFFEDSKVMLIKQSKQYLKKQVKTSLNRYNNLHIDNITMLASILSSTNTRFIIIDKNLKQVATNIKKQNVKVDSSYPSKGMDKNYITVSTPIKIDNKKYTIKAFLAENSIKKQLIQYSFYIFISLMVTLLIASGVWFLLISYLFLDMEKTITILKKISSGNLSLKRQLTSQTYETKQISYAIKKIIKNTETIMKQQLKFGAGIAHELKTPISVLKGSIEIILKSGCENPKDTLTLANNMLNKINRLDLLCTKLLEGAKLNNFPILNKTNFNVKEFLKDCVKDIEILANDREIKIKGGLAIEIFADKNLIRQVVLNLIENAIHYTEKQGLITIDWKLLKDGVEISIEDNGQGIKEAELPLIFEPFYKTDRKRDGTGLGLAFCKSVIESHGGYIYANSTLLKGSIFTFVIPFEQ